MVFIVDDFTEDIEEENAHVFMKILVVEEELREKGQILAVNWIFIAIDLEHGQFLFLVPVDLITRRMSKGTNFRMAFEFYIQSEEAEAEITDVQTVKVVVVYGIWTEIPSVSSEFSHLEAKDSLELGDLLVSNEFGIVHAEVRVVIWVQMGGDLLVWGILVNLEGGGFDAGEWYPIVVALVEVLEVHVVAV